MGRWRQLADDFTGRNPQQCGAKDQDSSTRCDALRSHCAGPIHRNSTKGREFVSTSKRSR